MQTKSKFWLILVLMLALSACSPFPQTNPQPDSGAQSETPSIPLIPSPTASALASQPAPPFIGMKMINAREGWAWTSTNRLLHTSDGGSTWLDRTPAGQIQSNGFFPLDGQMAWLPVFLEVGGRFGLLQTSDGGQNWTEYPSSPASGLHFSDALNGWAVSGDVGAGNVYFSLYDTRDGGKTWAPISVRPPRTEEGLPAGTIHLCNICNDSFYYDPDRMIIVNGDMGSMETRGFIQVQISFDLGTTWSSLHLPLPQNSPDALVSPNQPVFFGEQDGLLPVSLVKLNGDGTYDYQRLAFYATHDGGASWTLSPGGLEDIGPFIQIHYASSQDVFVLCGNSLCASHDGTQSWQTLSSNLEFAQNDNRSVWLLSFLDAATGWVSITENENTSLYQTADGGNTWLMLTPHITVSVPATTKKGVSVPPASQVPIPTPEPTSAPEITFDENAKADRIRFAAGGTWVEFSDSLSANLPNRYILSAMKGQIMSVSVPQGAPFSVQLSGADKKSLSDPQFTLPFWRGTLPSSQDYIVSVESPVSSPFTLRIAINPPGKAIQIFDFKDPKYLVALRYPDEFAPTDVQIPVNPKGTPLLTLAFIDPAFYSPRTNLSEAYFMLAATSDPGVVSICTEPSTQVPETVTGQVNINNYAFTRSEFSGAAAGNRYDQVAYRTVWKGTCFEGIILIHSTNIGNYPAGTVVEYNQAALMQKLEAVLNTFLAG